MRRSTPKRETPGLLSELATRNADALAESPSVSLRCRGRHLRAGGERPGREGLLWLAWGSAQAVDKLDSLALSSIDGCLRLEVEFVLRCLLSSLDPPLHVGADVGIGVTLGLVDRRQGLDVLVRVTLSRFDRCLRRLTGQW
jgi:hypothetical protein